MRNENLSETTDEDRSFSHFVIGISSRKVLFALTSFAIVLAVLSIIAQTLMHTTGMNNRVTMMFDLDGEHTIPSFFSALLLMSSSILLGIIGYFKYSQKDRFCFYWIALSLVFAYLAVDESASIHEGLQGLTNRVLGARLTWLHNFSWVLPVGVLVAIMGTIYIRFWWHFERRFKTLIFLSGFIYLSGAIGMEALNSLYASNFGQITLWYKLLVVPEEFLEMFGVILFIYSLLEYSAHYLQKIGIKVVSGYVRQN